jgi:CheY-like chemotaxis protein
MEPDKLHQTILVVDDDYAIRRFVKIVLENEGYDVLAADGAESAMKLYDQSTVALLLTDVVMPSIDGLELADRLLRREPQLRILFMSGSENASRGFGCVAKPFTGVGLIRRVGEVLESLPTTRLGQTAAA